MEKVIKKTPFKDLAKTLKEIKIKPLSEEKVSRINSIVNIENDEFENIEPLKKIAKLPDEMRNN